MANTAMVSVHLTSISPELSDQLGGFYNRLLSEHKTVLDTTGLPPRVTLLGRHHDALIAITTTSLLIVAAEGGSTEVSSTHRYIDYSSQGQLTPRDLMRSAARDLGWHDMVSLQFDRRLLDAPEEEQRKEFRRVSQHAVREIRMRQETADALGVAEALTYVDNARARFDAGGAAGFSDSKANCRNAIVSLVRGLAGTEKIRDGVRKLHEEGLLGEREAETIEAIEQLVAKLHGLASKTGTHPPLATEDDARFTLRLTEAAVEYLVGTVAKAKGL